MTATPRSLLCVDADETFAQQLQQSLITSRMRVFQVSSIDAARQCLGEQSYDMIWGEVSFADGKLSDLRQTPPDSDGPIVVVSNQDAVAIAVGALKSFAFDYLIKSRLHMAEVPGIVTGIWQRWIQYREELSLRAQLDQFFRLESACLCVATADGRFTRVNPAMTLILGWSAEELTSRPYVDFIHPDDQDMTRAKTVSLQSDTQITRSFLNRYLCKDGSYRWMSWSCTPVTADGFVYGIAQDVTDRVEREAEEREQAIARAQLNVLSPREQEVVKLVVDGLPNKTVAARLNLAEKTVEKHRTRLMRKLHVRNLPELVRLTLLAGSDIQSAESN